MDVTSSDIQMMNLINCVVRIHRLDLPLDVVVKVPLWDENIWEEPASSRKQRRSLRYSGLHEPVQEAEKENLGEALDWMTPIPSSSGSPVNLVDGTEAVTQEVLTGPKKQRRRRNVLKRETEKSVTRRDGGSRSCVVSGSTARVVHLPRHLRRMHQWSPQKALDATEKPVAAARGRRTKTCIVDGCTAVVVHLTRHLRQVHHLGPSEIRRAIFGSKKPRPLTSRRGKKRCPLEGCGCVRRNIYQHMRKFHGLEKGRRGWSTLLKWNVSGTESGELYPTTSSTWRSVEEGSKQEEPPKQEMEASNNQRHLCGNITGRHHGEIKPCGRGTKSCIVSGCTAVVIHLPRHLRQVHQWSPQEARDAVQSLRKPWSPTSRPLKTCPVEGCGRMTQRIPQHMRQYHKLQIGPLAGCNIKKAQVELQGQDGSIHGPEVVESSIISSSELLDDGSVELLLSYPTTISTCEEEGLQGEEPPQEETELPDDQSSPCCSITDKATENGEIKPRSRGTRSCIVSGCTAVVIHLPRHLRQVHEWSPQEARDAVHSAAKPLSPTSRPLQTCPVEGCNRKTQRIPQHLRQYHKLHIDSLAQHNIQKAEVELEGQDGSIHGPEVVESSIVSSSELLDDGSVELLLSYPTTISACDEEGLQGEEPPQEETELPDDQSSPCCSITDKATENGEIKPCGRGTRSCIVSGCTAVVIHLPRHLRQVHQWSPQEARDAVHSLRKPWSPTSRPLKTCPVEGCGRVTQRIPQHLRQYHKLHIGSLKRHNIQKAEVELEGQDGSIHGPEVIESSIISSSELLDDGSVELLLSYPTTISTCDEEGLQGEEPPQEETELPDDQSSPCCSITDKATENGELKPRGGRGTRSCIVSGCTAVVIHLPRHLRQVHQWSHQEARDAVQSLRKPWSSPTSRPLKTCPVEGCGRMTQRVSQHMRQYHKLHDSQDMSNMQVADDDAC